MNEREYWARWVRVWGSMVAIGSVVGTCVFGGWLA